MNPVVLNIITEVKPPITNAFKSVPIVNFLECLIITQTHYTYCILFLYVLYNS